MIINKKTKELKEKTKEELIEMILALVDRGFLPICPKCGSFHIHINSDWYECSVGTANYVCENCNNKFNY